MTVGSSTTEMRQGEEVFGKSDIAIRASADLFVDVKERGNIDGMAQSRYPEGGKNFTPLCEAAATTPGR